MNIVPIKAGKGNLGTCILVLNRLRQGMRIAITGGTGFLGRALTDYLAKHKSNELYLLCRKQSMWKAGNMAKENVNVVDIKDAEVVLKSARDVCLIHCATDYGRGNGSATEMVEANLIMPLWLLEQMVKYQPNGIFINTDTILDKRVSDYSLSKSQFREWIKKRCDRLKIANVALEHFYGARDNPGKFTSYVFESLITGRPYIELTEGLQKRDFIYIDDVVSAFVAIMDCATKEKECGYRHYEVGAGASIPVRQFVMQAKKIFQNTETDLQFGTLPMRANEVMDVRVDTRPLEALGWKPKYTVDSGIAKTYREMREYRASHGLKLDLESM
ncbi:NAD(P)-dependent oxidoreductase [Synechococcus sp. HK05]|uniref:NAD-dependent epimerase/dehydratase family protein n=1 Tax=Synechococcus sp. HK05 TaxID=2725975 RepID=UPI001C38F88B|nr:NAD(P)-dependent oxidoreductase [Synechococcus sp. HK05]MBV2352087.1 NAD(P)-dependent oxidoreductase [Synechococcus sp. HK05]